MKPFVSPSLPPQKEKVRLPLTGPVLALLGAGLDDAPSLDLPAMNVPSFDMTAESEPEPPEMAAPPVGAAMPAWETTPAPPPITPMQPFIKPPKTPEPEPEWGFDEAQIETARRATETPAAKGKKDPPPMKAVVKKASKPGKWIDTLIIAVAIVIIGFSGYAIWLWWQNKQAEKASVETVVVKRPVKQPAPVVVAPVVTNGTNGTTATNATNGTNATVAPPAAVKPTVIAATAPPTTTRLQQTNTGGMVITNAGATKPAAAVPPTTDADRARYETMAKEFAADKSGSFTIQFELVCEPASITRALREGGNSVWFVPISYRNKSCYRVFWGRYPTQDSAQSAIAGIPQSLREAAPVVVHIPK